VLVVMAQPSYDVQIKHVKNNGLVFLDMGLAKKDAGDAAQILFRQQKSPRLN